MSSRTLIRKAGLGGDDEAAREEVQAALVTALLMQRQPLEKLHDDAGSTVRQRAEVRELNDVRMVESPQRARLEPDVLDNLRRIGEPLVQELQDERAVRLPVSNEENLAHPARAEPAHHAVRRGIKKGLEHDVNRDLCTLILGTLDALVA